MRRVLAGIVALCLSARTATAIDSSGSYTNFGEGQRSCGTWLQDVPRKNAAYYAEAGWIAGFVTAYNRFVSGASNVAEGTDTTGMEAWISGYCMANPLDNLAVASAALIAELKRRVSH